MGAPISDKIRKLQDAGQTVRFGPGHAGFYVGADGVLRINTNGTPQAVAPVYDETNTTLWLGAHYNDAGVLVADGVAVLSIQLLIDEGEGLFLITTYNNQVAGVALDTQEANIGAAASFSNSEFFFGPSEVEPGVLHPNQLTTGAAAGPIVLTGITEADELTQVLAFDPAGPSFADLTDEFTISNDDEIDNTGGTDTTGFALLVTWRDLTP